MISVLEFYNKVHAKSDGKFADTPGPGHAKGAPKATPAQKVALKKVLSKPNTSAGSVIVPSKTTALKNNAKKSTPTVAKKADAPAVAKKAAAPTKKSGVDDGGKIPDIDPKNYNPQASALSKTLSKALGKNVEVYVGNSTGPYRFTAYVGNSGGGYAIDPHGKLSVAQVVEYIKSKPNKSDDDVEIKAKSDQSESSRIEGLAAKIGATNFLDGKAVGMNQSPPPKGAVTSKLTDEHLEAMLKYRGTDEIWKVNAQLRSGKATHKLVEPLDSAFASATPTTADITVYRVIRSGDVVLGKKFTDDAYVSTAYDKGMATQFADTMSSKGGESRTIAITIPRGTKVLKMSDAVGGESELLLPRGSSFIQQPNGSYIARPPHA